MNGPKDEPSRVPDVRDRRLPYDYADDGVAAAVQCDGPGENVGRAAERGLPKILGNQGDGGGADSIFAGQESPADERADAQLREEGTGKERAWDLLRFARAADREGVVAVDGHGRERPVVLLPIEKVRE